MTPLILKSHSSSALAAAQPGPAPLAPVLPWPNPLTSERPLPANHPAHCTLCLRTIHSPCCSCSPDPLLSLFPATQALHRPCTLLPSDLYPPPSLCCPFPALLLDPQSLCTSRSPCHHRTLRLSGCASRSLYCPPPPFPASLWFCAVPAPCFPCGSGVMGCLFIGRGWAKKRLL